MWNSLYFTVSVMTSTGYGEYYPQTLLGKIVTVLAAYTGQIILALGIVCIGFTSRFNALERKAFNQVQQDSA